MNFVQQRILKESQQRMAHPPIAAPIVQPIIESPVIPPSVLKEKLLEKLNPKPKIIQNPNLKSEIEVVHFATLFEFAHWYSENKTKFSEPQQKPLDTLIEAKNLTIGGCNCDREKRKFIAEDYFRKFWSNNKATDLPATLLKVLNTKKVLFGDFFSFPS